MPRGCFKVAFVVILVSFVFACTNSSERAMDDKLKNSYFAMCYTLQFAERFSLPTAKAIELSPGLAAIALEVRPDAKSYDTYIHLYLNSDLDIYSPNGECDYYAKPKAESFFPEHYNDKDYKWNGDNIFKANGRMLFRSQNLNPPDRCVVDGLDIEMFRREFLPGLNLLSTQVNSSFLDIQYAPFEIFIQKNKVGDYLLGDEDPFNLKHPENLYVFKLPERLHRIIQPYLKHLDTKIKYLSEDFRPVDEFP